MIEYFTLAIEIDDLTAKARSLFDQGKQSQAFDLMLEINQKMDELRRLI